MVLGGGVCLDASARFFDEIKNQLLRVAVLTRTHVVRDAARQAAHGADAGHRVGGGALCALVNHYCEKQLSYCAGHRRTL